MKTIRLISLLSLLSLLPGLPVRATEPAAEEKQIAAVHADMDDAEKKVRAIVNQPVTHFPRSKWEKVGLFSPGWFDSGVVMPDFNRVDVRKFQEFPYAEYWYVASDADPAEMFIGKELEFNSMTKCFYTDLTIPKKRLSEAEMLEINRLYRIIGRDQLELARLQASFLSPGRNADHFFAPNYEVVAELALLSVVFLLLYRKLFVKKH